MEWSIPRIVIAATKSSSGKTTIVSGLLAALRKRGLKVQPYKIGPDYIDPGYHQLASGQPSHNLDSWLMSKETMQQVFINNAIKSDMAIIEGVMGLYDGGTKGISSTAEIAKLLSAPVVIVIDCKSMGASAAALALGFREYDREVQLAGVILNRLGSKNHEKLIREAMERVSIPVLGCVHRNDDFHMPERHLGLLPMEENSNLGFVEALGEKLAQELDIEQIIKLAHNASPMLQLEPPAPGGASSVVKIGLARDEAFSFYYPESIRALEENGAKLVEFSPLEATSLPEVDGLIFGGGFPEMFAAKLSANQALRSFIKNKAEAGMPIYAECGGFMYLSGSLEDFDGRIYQMCNILPCRVRMNDKLQMVGYVTAELEHDCILGPKGTRINGHEFHFSSEVDGGNSSGRAFSFIRSRNGEKYYGGYCQNNVLGSYLHMHFAGYPRVAESFVKACLKYKTDKKD